MIDIAPLLSAGAAAGVLWALHRLAVWLGLTEPEQLERFLRDQ